MSDEPQRRNRQAQLPEHPDKGCEFHPRCVSCPFPTCFHEVPSWAQKGIVIVADEMQCVKCRGRLRYEAGIDGHVLKCHQCGNEVPAQAPVARPQPANGTAPRLTHVASADWIAGAKHELERRIAVVAEADKHREEAERIHRALSVYGISIPVLPWKTGKKATVVASTSTPSALGTCTKCGREAALPAFIRSGDDRICRKTAECEARAAAKVPA